MKKYFYNTFAAAILLLTLLTVFAPKANACVDPDTIATLTFNYNADFSEIEIRIGNLKLHTETPNTFCSCALSSAEAAFQNPTYIAFVIAGTNTPFGNFDAWDNTAGADNAWNSEFPAFPSWSGYISEVINQGLNTTDNVEMVIRASAPAGTFVIVTQQDSLTLFTLGTDMWLPDEQTMAFDHPGIRNFPSDASSLVLNQKPDAYFDQLDNDILNATSDLNSPEFGLEVFPNPVVDQLWVSFILPEKATVTLRARDVTGRLVAELFHENLPEGEHEIPLDVQAVLPKNNLYLLEIQIDGAVGARKIVL